MLLRIIDLENSSPNTVVELILEYPGGILSFRTAPYTSPITENFRLSLARYFGGYPQSYSVATETADTVNKLLKFGQHLGDQLLGEDLQLVRMKEIIEDLGYANLKVQIESSRPLFFRELWECLILHDSKYVLSAAVKGYVRKFVDEDFPRDYPDLNYRLKVAPAAREKLHRLLNSDHSAAENQPLRILYLLSRPREAALPERSSCATALSLAAVGAGGIVDYEIHHAQDETSLFARLADTDRPVHVIQYDGPVVIEEGVPAIVLHGAAASDFTLPVTELAAAMVKNRVALFNLDARSYSGADCYVGLALVAQAAQRAGLGNIVGLAGVTNPWISGRCFEILYGKIAKGLSLEQAVIEARKQLQADLDLPLATYKPTAFHCWPLLVHYSGQSVTFFESPQEESVDDSPGLGVIHDRLFGFRSEMLPPIYSPSGDGEVVTVVENLRSSLLKTVMITGEEGMGKTQLAHTAAAYLAQKEYIDYGFYFDFERESYEPLDMLEMIAHALGVSQHELVENKLTQLRCCFVFDGLVEQENNVATRESLQAFFRLLHEQAHSLIFVCRRAVATKLPMVEVSPEGLSLLEQKILVAGALRQQKLSPRDETEDWDAVLMPLNGHPWLTQKIAPLLARTPAAALKEEIRQTILDAPAGSVVEHFYVWQWSLLSTPQQHLLLLCAKVQGLLFELLLPVFGHRELDGCAADLLTRLKDKDLDFSATIGAYEMGGFLRRVPLGRMLDPRCAKFLAIQSDLAFAGNDNADVPLVFSQVICEAIILLVRHIGKQANPALANYLLANRRDWVQHMEALWFGKDYRRFNRIKGALEHLLSQAKLEQEVKAWAVDLLSRSIVVDEEAPGDASLCWLSLASSALGTDGAIENQKIIQGASVWGVWTDAQAEPLSEQQLIVFRYATTFLESFYKRRQEWRNFIHVCSLTLRVYRYHEKWMLVIQGLQSLARVHQELNEYDQTVAYEDAIIFDIPYDDAPPGLFQQQLLEIILACIAREDFSRAQNLLSRLRNEPGSEKILDLMESVQSDLDYQAGNYTAALPLYCRAWSRLWQSGQQLQIQKVKDRLLAIEDNLGQEVFQEHFIRSVPAGTPQPRDFNGVFH